MTDPTYPQPRRILCAHADQNGGGAHWLEAGEQCILAPAEPIPTLTITRGLPGSGKSTWARSTGLPRVNRDDLRAMLLPAWPHGDEAAEDICTAVQHAAIAALLDAGHSVVADDTNLRPEHVAVLRELATDCGARFEVHDMTDVPVQVCIERDAARPEPVGEEAIRRMSEAMAEPRS